MQTERFSTALQSRALDRKRGTTPSEKQWRDGYVDGASSILAELQALVKKEGNDVPPSIRNYINQYVE